MSKLPDSQAAAEKAAIMTLGAFLGVRHFGAAGTLSLDEIFSPEQLLIDIETRDWVQRAVRGQHLGEDEAADWMAEIKAGITRSFFGLDSTLDYHKLHTWYPRRFERAAIGPWLRAGQPLASERLRDEVRSLIGAHDYELDADRREQIEEIYLSAQQALAR